MSSLMQLTDAFSLSFDQAVCLLVIQLGVIQYIIGYDSERVCRVR